MLIWSALLDNTDQRIFPSDSCIKVFYKDTLESLSVGDYHIL